MTDLIKCLVMCLTLSIIMTQSVYAKSENVVMGPYKVSFDLGSNVVIDSIGLPSEIDTETPGGFPYKSYDVVINGGYEKVYLTISNYRNRIQITPYDALRIVAKQFNNPDAMISSRSIDGRSGAICDINNALSSVTVAAYDIDNFTSVIISSTYPWNDGTLNLLKTIHVENGTWSN